MLFRSENIKGYDKLKEKIQEKINLVNGNINKLKDKPATIEKVDLIQEPKEEVTKQSLLQQSIDNLNTLSKEQLEKELDDALSKEGLNEKEQEQYYESVQNKLSNLEKEQNTATFTDSNNKSVSFEVGKLVTYQGKIGRAHV